MKTLNFISSVMITLICLMAFFNQATTTTNEKIFMLVNFACWGLVSIYTGKQENKEENK